MKEFGVTDSTHTQEHMCFEDKDDAMKLNSSHTL